MSSREPELYKDKIEVTLDGRQVFYLFFGGAVLVGLVFVLGVMVGRRVEARAHIGTTRVSATTDPLAALDALATTKPGAAQSLFPGNSLPPVTDVERTITEIEERRKQQAKPPARQESPSNKGSGGPEPASLVLDTSRGSDEHKGGEESQGTSSKKTGFTLQLSSFQDRNEAEAFLATITGAGYPAYVTAAEVGEKGTFYRVRIGSYGTLDAANAAKSTVEKALNKTATVMRM